MTNLKTEARWEHVGNEESHMSRIAVPGGWLYKSFAGEAEETMAFVPDPELYSPCSESYVKSYMRSIGERQ